MEPVKQQRITQSSTLKLVTKFLLAISFFSILLPIFLHYSNFQFFTCTFQLFSCKTDKNYMFLLCNGILVLIVNNAGLMGDKENREDRSELQEMKAASVADEAKGGVREEQHVEEKSLIIFEESKCARSMMMIEEEIKEQINEIAVIDHEDDEDGFGSLTAEELNKKCDDFIRKMKAKIKLEAQTLIIV